MSSVAQMVKPKEKSCNWTSTFPSEQVTEQQSSLFMKKLIAVAISNITYLRAIFPENAFGNRKLEDLHLKILSENSGCPGACQVITWVKGCFEALDNKYLRQLLIGIYTDPDDSDNVIEAYTFRFSYTKQGTTMTCNGEKVVSVPPNASELTRKSTLSLLRTILILTQSLDPLPNNAYMTMKLLYYDDVTPPDYEPPGFKPSETDTFFFKEEPINIKVGDVSTAHHCLKLRIKTDKKQFDVLEENPVPAESKQVDDSNKDSEDGNHNMKCSENNKDISFDDKEEENKLLQPKQCDDIPLSSPTVPDKKGINNEQTDNVNDEKIKMEDNIVQCPCGFNQDDGLMISCVGCDKWQHGVCFGVLEEEDAPESHVCEKCYKPNDNENKPTDLYLSKLPFIEQQALCVWRRALVSSVDLKTVSASILAKRLQIDKCVAESIIERMEKEGYVANGVGRLKGRKAVNKELIINKGYQKYIARHDSEDGVTDKHITENCKDSISDDSHLVAELSKKTQELNVSSLKDSNFRDNSSHGKKRNLQDFDISDSQEMSFDAGDSRKKRRKASTCKKGIPV